ncbi:MAG: hypothetical protein GVY24_07120 [Planctomycetes bacterium]|jgi:hypothetical protein|nr:hypothetical protein [Planctomycetota bacterium]
MSTFRVPVLTALIAATALLFGCQGPSYVNIPAESGDVAFHSPNGRTVRAVVAVAIDGIVSQTPLDGPVALSLPTGAEALTYEAVAAVSGSNVIPAAPDDEGAQTTARIRVTAVRVRGHKAEVDAVRAKPGGAEQLVTVHLSWNAFSDWGVTRIRAWNIPVEANVPG